MRKIIIAIIIIFALIQFIPVNRDNPVSEASNEIVVNPDIKNILENSCFDCHSNKTVWPMYSYVAPASWFVVKHVHDGREELNFSEWNTYSEKRKNKKFKELFEEVDEGEMPLTSYLLLHQNAKLTATQKETLIQWTQANTEVSDSGPEDE